MFSSHIRNSPKADDCDQRRDVPTAEGVDGNRSPIVPTCVENPRRLPQLLLLSVEVGVLLRTPLFVQGYVGDNE